MMGDLRRTSRATAPQGTTASAVLEAAVAQFSERGYHGTSLRDIATAVGIKVGSLYNHMRSKDELLGRIVTKAEGERLADLNVALEAESAPARRLAVAVRCHVQWAIEHPRELAIAQSETRSLTADDRRRARLLRQRYDATLQSVVEGAGPNQTPPVDPGLLIEAMHAIVTGMSARAHRASSVGRDALIDDCSSILLSTLGRNTDCDAAATPIDSVLERMSPHAAAS